MKNLSKYDATDREFRRKASVTLMARHPTNFSRTDYVINMKYVTLWDSSGGRGSPSRAHCQECSESSWRHGNVSSSGVSRFNTGENLENHICERLQGQRRKFYIILELLRLLENK